MIPYELLGKIFVVTIIILIIIFLTSLLLGYLMVRNGRILFPRVMLLLWNIAYLPLRRIAARLKFNELLIDNINIELSNLIYFEDFKKTPVDERIIFLPQCLRSIKCVAKMSSRDGIMCKRCGACQISEIIDAAEKMGYKKIYIVPGGSFVKRVLKLEKSKAVFAVGCTYEIGLGLLLVYRYGRVARTVPLLKDGCVCTEVDVEEVINSMKIGITDSQ
ncbi:MAG: polyprenyl synthetase [Candidatus Altiarchaeales archaeon HGW-Altiarchaeales-3]|nr:MAG: polyprenyl synthetase [Candidatus Altiarchaeales archaeon HGW-Altiarchaeales-3]